jgi:hypothetical protein
MSQTAFQEYSAKAQELLGQTKKAAVDKGIVSPETAQKVAPEKSASSEKPIVGRDFPTAPTVNPSGQSLAAEPAVSTQQPLAA